MSPENPEQRFASWMRDYISIVRHIVNAFAAGHDRHDLMQEIAVALWRAAPAFQGGSKPSTFVYRVAHNAALTWRRTERKHQRHIEAAGEIDWMSQPDTARGRADTPARLEALYAAIRTLQPIDRSIVVLSLDGLSYREIAEVHGLSESNVGVRLTRARKQLTDIMTGEIFDELRPTQ